MTGHVATSRQTRSLIDDAVVEMSADLDDSSRYLAESIHENLSRLEDDLYLATRQSCRANVGLITTMIGEGAEPVDFAPPEEALSYARDYVHNGLSMEYLSNAYREGQRAFSRLWLERLQVRAADAGELADAMGYVSDWLFGYIARITDSLAGAYAAEHDRWINGAMAMRAEEVRAILGGADVDVVEASSRLRYRLDGKHVAFVIWNEAAEAGEGSIDDTGKVVREITRFASDVASSLGASSSLSLPLGRYYAGWAAVKGEPDLEVVPEREDGLRVAIGRLGHGVDGFRRSHQEALLTRRVASLSAVSAPCLSYESAALDALLTSDLEEGRRFVAHELGPLLEDSDTNRRLLATLEVFLDERSSFVGTARRLGIHQNTVSYRVHRAEELLGRRVADRPFELRMALRLAHFVVGDYALSAAPANGQ